MILRKHPYCCYELVATIRGFGDQITDSVFAQDEQDIVAMAVNLGFRPCKKCRESDGSVGCEHKEFGEMVSAARDWLDARDGKRFKNDLGGYFDY